MTEAEWLVSENALQMIRDKVLISLSEQKVKCVEKALELDLCGQERYTVGGLHTSVRIMLIEGLLMNIKPPYQPVAAHILRDIIGNPFHPHIVLPRDISTVLKHGASNYQQRNVVLQEWLTPTVVSLAAAAYEQRPGKLGDVFHLAGVPCRDRTKDGPLDHQRLSILADALEDTGCQDQVILQHLRGLVWCSRCKGTGRWDREVDAGYGSSFMTRPGWEWCYLCNDYGKGPTPGWYIPRQPVVHVRGCWVVDLLLDKG